MKNGKKLTAAMTASTVVAAMAAPAAFASVQLNDINGSYAKDAIQALVDKGIINGKGDGNFDPTGLISRQDFAIILAKAAGLDVSSAPATATFSDVPTTSYAFKYVEAAHKAGLLAGNGDGTFGATAQLSRQDMATFFARALKQSTGTDYAGKGASLKFTDSASIADYAKDAVGLAVELGYISGNPDGSFNPKGNAERQAVASVAYRFLAAVDKIKGQTNFAITTDATNVKVGQKVHFKVDGATSVAWSVSGNGVIDANGDFVGNASGSVTVTALVNGTTTVTKTISVYGVASGVTISELKDMAANEASTQDVTITVVDANGNKVDNFNGYIDLATDNAYVAFLDADGNQILDTGVVSKSDASVHVVNGQAVVKIQANTSTPGLTDTITASNLIDSVTKDGVTDFQAVSADVKLVEQVATALKLSVDHPIVPANDSAAGAATVKVQVVDQDGVVMKSGAYGVVASISGPAVFDATGDTSDQNSAFDSGSADATTFAIDTLKGKTGTITVTAKSEGLTTGTATIKVAVAADPAKLALEDADDATVTEYSYNQDTKATGLNFNVNMTDENGTPVAYPVAPAPLNQHVPQLYVFVTDAAGNAATNIQVTPQGGSALPMTSKGVSLGAGVNNFNIIDDGTASAGTYKLVVKDMADTNAYTATPSTTFNIGVDTKEARQLSLSAATDYVTADAPTTTVTAQVEDYFGNPLKTAGIPVTFNAHNLDNTVKGAFNGKAQIADNQDAAFPTVTAYTDANGVAKATFTSAPINNATWNITASDAVAEDNISASSAETIQVMTEKVASLSIVAKGDNNGTQVQSGHALTDFAITQLNSFGYAISSSEDDQVKVTLSNPEAFDLSSALGTGVTLDATAGTITGKVSQVNNFFKTAAAPTVKAGNVTFTVTDLSVPTAKSAATTVKVIAGDFVGFDLFDAAGNIVNDSNLVSVEANKEVKLTLRAVDANHNATVDKVGTTVTLGDLNNNGYFRTVSNGATLPGNSFTFTKGALSQTIYYVNATAGSYQLTVNGPSEPK